MGEVRAYSRRKRWSPEEEARLAAHYRTTPRAELATMFPDRDIRSVECKANMMGLCRPRRIGRTADQVRAAKREHMARRRAADPDRVRAYNRQQHALNKDKRNRQLREWNSKRLFRSRANRLKGITARNLARLWRDQRGLCALTGRRLDRTAEVDHKLPKTRGGTDALENLQWVCREANRAKRDLTDLEFLALCQSVTSWIGARIQWVEDHFGEGAEEQVPRAVGVRGVRESGAASVPHSG